MAERHNIFYIRRSALLAARIKLLINSKSHNPDGLSTNQYINAILNRHQHQCDQADRSGIPYMPIGKDDLNLLTDNSNDDTQRDGE